MMQSDTSEAEVDCLDKLISTLNEPVIIKDTVKRQVRELKVIKKGSVHEKKRARVTMSDDKGEDATTHNNLTQVTQSLKATVEQLEGSYQGSSHMQNMVQASNTCVVGSHNFLVAPKAAGQTDLMTRIKDRSAPTWAKHMVNFRGCLGWDSS